MRSELLLQGGWQQTGHERQVARGNAVVESQRKPRSGPVSELRVESVLEQADVWTVEERVSGIEIESRHIRLLTESRRRNGQKQRERNQDVECSRSLTG